MKKLLLFVIACTLGLFGTVSAQTTVTIGTGTESGYAIADNYDGHGASQQIYTAAEIGSAGTITSIAFQKANGSDYDRTWSIYMKHIDEENFTGNLNYIMTADELVYEGTFTTTNDWIVFNIDPFQYDGEHNLIVTVVDNSGVYGGDQNWYYTSIPFDNGSKCLSKYFMADIDITQQTSFSAFAGRFNIQLTFAAAGEGGGEEEGGEELASEFSFDFEDGTLNGLRVFAGEGSSAPLWAVGNVGNGTGIFSMSYNGTTWMTYADVDNYVVTENQYQITENSVLSWYLSHSYPDYAAADVCAVVVSEDGETFTAVGTYQYDEATTTKECSLAAYAGKNLYVGFRHYCTDEYGGESLILDDIKLSLVEGGEGGETPDPTPEPEPEPEDPDTIVKDIIVETGADKNPNSNGNFYFPVYDFAAYAMSQQIYTAEELGGNAGTIKSVAFRTGTYGRTPETRQYEVYLTNTSLNMFESGAFVALTEDDKVFDGDVVIEGTLDSWYTIEFTEPFNYTGENIVLTVYDKTGVALTTNYHQFYKYSAAGRSLYKQGTVAYDMFNLGTGYAQSFVSQVRLDMTVSLVLTTPVNVVATAQGSSAILLSWSNVGAASSYNVYNGTELVANVEGTTYVVEGLEPETEYCYTVTAVSESGNETEASAEACATTTVLAPIAPTNLVATSNGESSVTLEWDVVETATSYNVYKGTALLANVEETSYIVEGLEAETTYCFTVKAVNNGGESEASAEACAKTDEFTGCYVFVTMTDSYNDGWNGNKLVFTYGLVSKELTLAGGGSGTEVLAIPQGAHVTATFITAGGYGNGYPQENGFTIAYESGEVIVSVAQNTYPANTAVNQSYEFDVACVPVVPATPVVTAEATGSSTIVLTMTAAGADSYNVYQNGELLVEGLTETTYTVNDLTAETEYCFTVVAVNEVGESEVSEEVCAKTYAEGTVIVTIGEGSRNGFYAPISNQGSYAKCSLSQQIYLAEEINSESCHISAISFHNLYGGSNTRNIVVYMTNVNETSYASGSDWINVTEADIVYQGEHTFGANDEWTTIEFQTPFIYRGKNVCITVNDLTGVAKEYSGYDSFYCTDHETVRGLYATKDSQFDCTDITSVAGSLVRSYDYTTGMYYPHVANIILRTEAAEIEAIPVPNAPANLVAETNGFNSIALSWEASENAESYNVYQGTEKIAEGLTTTSYVVSGLSDNTEFCFTVTAVNLEGESEASESVCATTDVFEGCYLVFTLNDTYGDGWSYDKLIVTIDGASQDLTFQLENMAVKEYVKEYNIPVMTGSTVNVKWQAGAQYSYPSEESFVVKYEGGAEIINTGELTHSGYEHTFVVDCAAEETPTFTHRLESVGTAWGNTAYTFDEENANRVVAIDEDGIVTEVTYNEAGQIASAVATVEEIDEEGNPIEVVLSGVEYEYDENGLWTSFTETVQGWFGGTVTSETVLGYDAEGKLVSLTSPEYVRTIAYNAEGLISEVIEGYVVVEEGEEEGEEEGDDNGIAPLSETEIEYSSKITFEYDAEGRLVEKNYYSYDAYETMEFYWGESEVYTYDENGNCVKKEAYEVTEENELKSFPYSVTEYIYDLTINNENVYSFEYPHFAFINYVEPSYANILVKEMSFYSYYDEDVEEVVSHSYEVTAYNYNPAVVLLPLTPMNLTAEVLSATEVELAWAGFPDAESFTLYQGETVIAEGLVDPYYTVENLEMGVEYCFAVMATNSVGNSEVSETVCVTIELPAAPANLVAEAISDTEIALTWEEIPGIWSYNVYQVVETAEETTYELLGEAWWTEYTVSELTAETEYSFVVKAVSNVGESAASNVATATTLAPAAPTVPAAPVVTGSFEGDKVILEWEAVEGALAYNLYFGGNLLAGPFEDVIVEIQVPEAGEYCFTVTAINEVGESEHSEEVCVTVTAPEDMEAPAAPVLEATLDGNKAILSWEAVEGATYYDVYVEAAPGQGQYLGTATMEDLPISLELPQPGEYCFYVIAYNLAGASEPSNVACVNYGEGVEENEASFNIYPNPVSDNLVIETEANIEAVTIYTVTGVVVYNEVEFSNNTINVSDFANGVYIMKVRTENGEAVQRFIKK